MVTGGGGGDVLSLFNISSPISTDALLYFSGAKFHTESLRRFSLEYFPPFKWMFQVWREDDDDGVRCDRCERDLREM